MSHHFELQYILRRHMDRYPDMRATDAVKLIFQNEFCGGHLITDAGDSLTRLRSEYTAVQHDNTTPPIEPIGNDIVRVNLAALDDERCPLERLNHQFVRSAHLHVGSRDVFLQKLSVLTELTAAGKSPFGSDELGAYLEQYAAAGYPPVSHSEVYRTAYAPAYRVLQRHCLPEELTDKIGNTTESIACALLSHIDHMPSQKTPLLVAIDGRCASGKTTLAIHLQNIFGWSVVHMDHFFLRPQQRTPQRLAAPGGNIDHERFLSEVLIPLSRGLKTQYRPFDCHTQQMDEPISVAPTDVILVEGSYCCHPSLIEYYDAKFFLSVSPETQLLRITARNGQAAAAQFQAQWIPLEERYFSLCQPAQQCDLCLES